MPASRVQRLTFGVLATAVAVGFALWWLVFYGTVEAIGTIRSALDEGEEDEFLSPTLEVYDLSFDIGGTEIYYGQTLAGFIAAAIVALVALLVLRIRAPVAPCPHCLSPVPAGAVVCASCTRDLRPNVH